MSDISILDTLHEIQEGRNLDKYIKNENSEVRVAIARYGHCLDVLIHDKDPLV